MGSTLHGMKRESRQAQSTKMVSNKSSSTDTNTGASTGPIAVSAVDIGTRRELLDEVSSGIEEDFDQWQAWAKKNQRKQQRQKRMKVIAAPLRQKIKKKLSLLEEDDDHRIASLTEFMRMQCPPKSCCSSCSSFVSQS